jgi:hypothetical protein
MRLERVVYDMAEPAKRIDVLLLLVTLGKKGKLFVRKKREFDKWSSMDAVNCRCVVSPLTDSHHTEER